MGPWSVTNVARQRYDLDRLAAVTNRLTHGARLERYEMGLLTAVGKRLHNRDGTLPECRHCGTNLAVAAGECASCGSRAMHRVRVLTAT